VHDFRIQESNEQRCYGQLATLAVATIEPLANGGGEGSR